MVARQSIKTLPNAVVNRDETALGRQVQTKIDLKTFSKDIIKTVGTTIVTVNCNDWKARNVKVTIVKVRNWPIIGRFIFQQLVFSLNQPGYIYIYIYIYIYLYIYIYIYIYMETSSLETSSHCSFNLLSDEYT